MNYQSGTPNPKLGATNLDTSARQLSFEFAGNSSDGLNLWREQQRESLRRLGVELGLPLGSHCEVVLETGIQVRGQLVLDEEGLFLSSTRKDARLRVGNLSFSIAEISGCVRLD